MIDNQFITRNGVSMILERTENEILIRMPLNIDVSDLQNLLDYLKYKELIANSKAQQVDADSIAQLAKISMMKKFKDKRKIK
mgnify:CR=1 FL=1